MLEAIGFFTVLAVLLFLLINHTSKPNKAEQERMDIKKEENLKKVTREESKKMFILQYKDFLLPLLMNGAIDYYVIKEKLITTYHYSDELASKILSDMISYGMICRLENNTVNINYSLKQLKYLYPNFYKFCELTGENKNYKNYSFISNSPYLIRFINSNLYIESTGMDLLNSHLKFGIITNNQATKEFGTNNILNNKFNLYLIAYPGIYCESYHTKNGTLDLLKKYTTILNHKRLIVGDIFKLDRDLQIQDYKNIFERSYNKLYRSESFKFIFGDGSG